MWVFLAAKGGSLGSFLPLTSYVRQGLVQQWLAGWDLHQQLSLDVGVQPEPLGWILVGWIAVVIYVSSCHFVFHSTRGHNCFIYTVYILPFFMVARWFFS